MDHRAFFEELKKGNIASCYVFEGPEEYIKRSALEALRARLLPEGLAEMNETRLRDPDANGRKSTRYIWHSPSFNGNVRVLTSTSTFRRGFGTSMTFWCLPLSR